MESGASFENLWLSLESHPWERERRSLRAAHATVGNPPHLLRIAELRFSVENALQPLELYAASAVYDTRHAGVALGNGFHASILGFGCQGAALRGDLEQLRFHAIGSMELFTPGPQEMAQAHVNPAGPFFTWSQPSSLISKPLAKSLPRLMHQIAGNLADFSRCWDLVITTPTENIKRPSPSIRLMSFAGGSLDLRQGVIDLTGPAAVLGPGLLLHSGGGIRVAREEFDGAVLVRASGDRGLQGWLAHTPSSHTWIVSQSFEWVNDGAVIQFTGGPLEITRNGTILKATEDWQYLRLFEGRRIVLSPGSWTTETDSETAPDDP